MCFPRFCRWMSRIFLNLKNIYKDVHIQYAYMIIHVHTYLRVQHVYTYTHRHWCFFFAQLTLSFALWMFALEAAFFYHASYLDYLLKSQISEVAAARGAAARPCADVRGQSFMRHFTEFTVYQFLIKCLSNVYPSTSMVSVKSSICEFSNLILGGTLIKACRLLHLSRNLGQQRQVLRAFSKVTWIRTLLSKAQWFWVPLKTLEIWENAS